MFTRMRRRMGQLEEVRFCDACVQVSTPASRARALRERTRTDALYLTGLPR
jgi:hypothetical protein